MRQLTFWHDVKGALRGVVPTHRFFELGPCELSDYLRAALGQQVHLAFTNNLSTMLSFRRHADVVWVRLHRMFERADMPIKEALAAYLMGDKQSGHSLDNFMRAQAAQLSLPLKRQRYHHDLQALFAANNARYFHNACAARIVWGARSDPELKRAMAYYDGKARRIVVGPALDKAVVPAYYVSWHIYQAMLAELFAPVGRSRRLPQEVDILIESHEETPRCRAYEASRAALKRHEVPLRGTRRLPSPAAQES